MFRHDDQNKSTNKRPKLFQQIKKKKKKSKAHENFSNGIIAYMICKTGFWMKQRKYDQKIRNPFPYLAEIEASKLTCCERWRKPRPQAKKPDRDFA